MSEINQKTMDELSQKMAKEICEVISKYVPHSPDKIWQAFQTWRSFDLLIRLATNAQLTGVDVLTLVGIPIIIDPRVKENEWYLVARNKMTENEFKRLYLNDWSVKK